ncbi:MAG: polymerase sporulation specific sigma factor SigH [Firmicutes bacterium]|nr:polymerase sporulation specific sigma factor SigH [Bacillota bacterium]
MNEEQSNWISKSDADLCALVATGDRTAEETLVLRYSRLVRVCARPYFLAGGDSEDLIQEGMLGLLIAIREFDPERKVAFRTFAELCIRRRMISAVRMAAGGKHTPLNTYVSLELSLFDGDQNQAFVGAMLSRQENPEDVMIGKEKLQWLRKMIVGQLTELENHILGFYLNGLSYTEIAKEVKRTTKSVDNAVQRIRRKVARQIQSSEYSES